MQAEEIFVSVVVKNLRRCQFLSYILVKNDRETYWTTLHPLTKLSSREAHSFFFRRQLHYLFINCRQYIS